jgi:formamidopyrimidine-DNA glycosylase
MIELPESNTLASQINTTLKGKKISSAIAGSSPHKFAWYIGEPADYSNKLIENEVISARGIGAFVEITLSNVMLMLSEGTNIRFHISNENIPKKHQLLVDFEDHTYLSVGLSMYGGIYCWEKDKTFDYSYYNTAKEKPSPLTPEFDEDYFANLLAAEPVQKLSLKAALATEQRIPGLGNGCLQDVLWHANLNPRHKLNQISDKDFSNLFVSIKNTLAEMTEKGGRNSEKDLFGLPGNYQVVMGAANKGKPCPRCGDQIQKASFMGGSIYICETCQPID